MGAVYRDARTRTWSITCDAPRGEDGKRRQLHRRGFATETEARRALTRLEADLQRGQTPSKNRLTVAAYLEQWLEHVSTSITPRTHAGYSQIVHSYLTPALGHLKLDLLTPLQVQRYFTQAQGKNGALSGRTLLHHYRVLRQALQQAVRWRLTYLNPADAITPPTATRIEQMALTRAECLLLLETAKEHDRQNGSEFYLPILLALTTGLRRGEICALRWEDIDLDRRRLVVRQAVEVTRGRLALKPPKGRRSRIVVFPPMTAASLMEARPESGTGLLLAGADGGLYHPDRLTHGYMRIRDKCGILARFHDLRHTQASLLFAGGIDAKIIQERLGHSSVSLTMDVYTHLNQEAQDEAADLIERALTR